MRFLPPEPEVELYETVFEDDFLDREKASRSLSALVERIEDPLVIALDGRWGTGKSYFLKRWVGAHQKQNGGRALTLYFDAFANDYMSDPLISLLAALTERLPAEERSKLDRLKRNAVGIIKPLLKIGAHVATFGAKEQLDELGDAVADAASGEAIAAIDRFWEREESRQHAMAAFRTALSDFVAGAGDGEPTPLVIVVDELDRCRPDYALDVLEIIKHFFAVPQVHFILGVNLVALENSVKARYGVGVDASAYLQKFVSLTIVLPERVGDQYRSTLVTLEYAKRLANDMGLPDLYVDELVEHQLPLIIHQCPISIRDMAKILGAVALLPPKALENNFTYSKRSVLVSMMVARVVRQDIFQRMISAEINKTEVLSFFGLEMALLHKSREGFIS